jgi:Rod binding domain-containing protein
MSALASPVDVGAAASAAIAQPGLRGGHVVTPAQAQKIGRDFEAIFMSQMMQQMFASVPTDGWFGGGSGEEMFRPMLIDQYGKLVANHGNGIGIADAVARTLLQAQEAHR